MIEYSEADLLEVLNLILLVQAAGTVAEFRRRLLRIGQLIPGHVIGYNEVAADGRTFALIDPPEAAFNGVEEVFARFAHQHPVISHFQETGDPGPTAVSDFLSEEEVHALDLYKHVWAPMEVEDQISLVLPSADDRTIGIAINRRERGFSERDRGLLRLLRPHLGQSFLDADMRERANPLSDQRLEALGLTRRQMEVARVLARGGTPATVAEELVISHETARNHIANVYRRLGVHSRAEAVARLLNVED